jgi:hypothetical protein
MPHALDYVEAGLDIGCEGRVTDGDAHALAGQVADTITTHIDAWSRRGWTNYDFAAAGDVRNPNTLTYQLLQAYLMEYIAARMDRPALARIAAEWETAAASLSQRLRALVGKARYRVSHGYGG